MWVATRGSWPYYFDATLVLLGVPGLTTRRKRCLPSGRRVCVTLGIIGILLDLFGWLLSEQGGPWTLGWHGPTKTHPSCRGKRTFLVHLGAL